MADELFRTNSIANLRGMLSKIQTEISQKKSLQRTCVGQRYRDVIQASDSIATMEVLVTEFQEILGNNDLLKGNLTTSPIEAQSIVNSKELSSVQAAIHLQLLVWVPEEVYRTKDYLNAAGLIAIGEWAFDMIMKFEKISEVQVGCFMN